MQAKLAQLGDAEQIARSLMASMEAAGKSTTHVGDPRVGLPGLPVDFGAINTSSAEFQTLVAQEEEQLARHPARRAQLEAMVRKAASDDDDEGEGNPGSR